MKAHCTTKQHTFRGIEGHAIVTAFDGGKISSDSGSLLLRQIEQGRGYLREFARCFRDARDQRFVEHGVESMLAQGISGLCLGYEDHQPDIVCGKCYWRCDTYGHTWCGNIRGYSHLVSTKPSPRNLCAKNIRLIGQMNIASTGIIHA